MEELSPGWQGLPGVQGEPQSWRRVRLRLQARASLLTRDEQGTERQPGPLPSTEEVTGPRGGLDSPWTSVQVLVPTRHLRCYCRIRVLRAVACAQFALGTLPLALMGWEAAPPWMQEDRGREAGWGEPGAFRADPTPAPLLTPHRPASLGLFRHRLGLPGFLSAPAAHPWSCFSACDMHDRVGTGDSGAGEGWWRRHPFGWGGAVG